MGKAIGKWYLLPELADIPDIETKKFLADLMWGEDKHYGKSRDRTPGWETRLHNFQIKELYRRLNRPQENFSREP
jgi:hypothetical protein